MSTLSGGPNTVTNGLVLYLDAANVKSYVSGSTTWTNLVNSNIIFNVTQSSMVYNSQGYFDLVGIGGMEYAGNITTSTTSSCVFWMKSTDLQSLFLEEDYPAKDKYLGAYNVSNKFYNSSVGTPTVHLDSTQVANIYDFFPDGRWHMIEFKSCNFSAWNKFRFNKYPTFFFTNTSIGAFMIYNRNLSQDESLQNYNAQKSRFGS